MLKMIKDEEGRRMTSLSGEDIIVIDEITVYFQLKYTMIMIVGMI